MRDLGPLEETIMNLMWTKAEPQTVRAIYNDIAQERSIAYTTVMTVMDNLFNKGMLGRERAGRAYVYSTTASREERTASLLSEVLADGGDRTGALLRFVEHLDEKELAALREAVSGNKPRSATSEP